MEVDAKGILYMIAENEFSLKRDTISDRLKLQKTIYLLEAAGMQLGYGFSWYKFGPYSQDLVRDAYTVLQSEKEKYKKATRSWRFSKTTIEKIEKFKEICANILDDLRQLELVASVDFVCSTWYPEKAADDTIVEIFKRHKDKFFDKTPIENPQIENAFGIFKQLREQANL